MNFLLEFYNLIFYQPISKLFFLFYQSFKDFGLAIFLLTLFIKIVLFPFDWKNAKEQEKLLKIQKEAKEIEEKFEGERKTKEILNLYKREKINPFFSFIFLFIQVPILIAIYQVFTKSVNQFEPSFLGIFNLSKPDFFLAFVAILLQFIYFKVASSKGTLYPSFVKMNFLFLPFLFLILLSLPSVISLYFSFTYFLLIFQKFLFNV
jgi:YidC/Oxa1 family membrane protein insertase